MTNKLKFYFKKRKKTISKADRALAMLEVQNTFSKHQYIIDNIEELNTIWVSQDGIYAQTAKFTQPDGIWEGMNTIFKFYGLASRENKKKTLESINELYPEIKVVHENFGIGTWNINCPNNPVIEIAGDGKTAKGIWESNGPCLHSCVIDGEFVIQGNWYWRKYALDFAKENDRWKIWHMNIVYDIISPLDAEYGMDYTRYKENKNLLRPSSFKLPKPTKSNQNPYKIWDPKRVPASQPKVPEPYYTFNETFSY